MRLFKYLSFVFMIMVLARCGGGQSTGDQATETNNAAVEVKPAITLPTLKDPCEILSAADITALGGFQTSNDGKANLISSDTWKVCDFLVDKKGLSISLKRYDDGIIERKGVASTYQKILAMEDDLTRIEVPNAPGDQAIFTYGQTNNPGRPYSYLLQWRYGNHTEGQMTMTYSDKQKADELLSRLVKIAEKLDE